MLTQQAHTPIGKDKDTGGYELAAAKQNETSSYPEFDLLEKAATVKLSCIYLEYKLVHLNQPTTQPTNKAL